MENNFTKGKILLPLLKFFFPVLFAMFLQAMYGAVDLLIVGQFSSKINVSAVSTGSQIMQTITNLIVGLSMGTTVLLGQMLGEGNGNKRGGVMGSSICFFVSVGIALTILIPVFSGSLAAIMNAPAEAFDLTTAYIRICGIGSLSIIAYNLIGSIFRGMGDSRTPLITVIIACICNIAGDLLLIAVFDMGAQGAAIATVAAQTISVLISLYMIARRSLPFPFSVKDIRFKGSYIKKIVRLGFPIALQDLLVGISFLVILAIVNDLGVVASAGVGVAEKVCGFIMLIPSAFSQSMAAFVAQNIGARRYDRAKKALFYAIGVSMIIAVFMFYISFFHGSILTGIFSNDADVIAAGAEYVKAYGIDCLLTCVFFCFIGFFNGLGYTRFVMIQGLVGAFCVRVPVSYLMSRQDPVSIFHIGLATPCSSAVQIILCLICFAYAGRKFKDYK